DNMLPIVVMTAWASIELAVDAMKRGARDFVTKPWDNQRLVTIVRTQIELAAALRRERKLEAENEMLRGTMPDLITQSPAMRPVIEMISRVAPSDANVLITGENGTGKSLIARAIHALSPRALRTMITVNMGGLSETLFESELFGHVKGAFTDAKTDRAGRFELADESTSCCWPTVFSSNTRSVIANRLPVSMTQRENVCCSIAFREMFESSIISWNVPCLWRKTAKSAQAIWA